MYYTIKRLYSKTHNEEVLTKAVAKGWITEEEKKQIINEVDTKDGE